jgi:hypothetical protein
MDPSTKIRFSTATSIISVVFGAFIILTVSSFYFGLAGGIFLFIDLLFVTMFAATIYESIKGRTFGYQGTLVYRKERPSFFWVLIISRILILLAGILLFASIVGSQINCNPLLLCLIMI